MHFEIVALEKQHQPLFETLDLPPDTTYSLSSYLSTTRDELHARIRNADIVIVTTVKLDAETLSHGVTPRLRYVIVSATGTDCVDLHSCQARAIHVCNCPGANLEAVSERAISLYFAARRRTVLLDEITRRQPRKRIAVVGRALGMKVLVAARKPSSDPVQGDAHDALQMSKTEDSLIVLSLPRNPGTLNLLSAPEFERMHSYAVLVNIARGGIVDEAAVVQALKEKRIAGYATDVYQVEPAGGPEDTPLLADNAKDLNFTLSPHLAWFSQRTVKNLGEILKSTTEAAIKGEDLNVVV
ncbi:glycerate dehydrogenase [Didymella exigua CBS 183.55]|uniref:Glycerate dehydrogenase n=1 Tax=Didymella exigua CBS 183.55 TaxID=1150837 RepID=A0A6A5RFR3_9PLEO|nr:glycerate dehydrogenase [Didymella exigua CBS 183.55]KAF1927135.1 glycerate dehydrogenase [Didymella exigua CBS 183.55]